MTKMYLKKQSKCWSNYKLSKKRLYNDLLDFKQSLKNLPAFHRIVGSQILEKYFEVICIYLNTVMFML